MSESPQYNVHAQQKFEDKPYISQAKLAEIKDDKTIRIIGTVALVSIAFTMRRQARIAARFANESIHLQKVLLDTYNIQY
jgi:hypothetical protein